MESASNLLIALDAGHGGPDTGGQLGPRQEKDDNLRLSLATKIQLLAQGFGVVCTRTGDAPLSPAQRAKIASEADADLFLSLHRGHFPTPSEEAAGVTAFIYPTASLETAGKAAHLLLSALEEVGVQRTVGISRGNHPVLRRAQMPAVQLEVGFISNEGDNRLFDRNLTGYAKAIAKGVTDFFGLAFNPKASVDKEPNRPTLTLSNENEAHDMQRLLEARYGFGLRPTGHFDKATAKAVIIALQIELNGAYGSQLPLTGNLGKETLATFRGVLPGEKGGLVALTQVLLILNGYEPGEVDGVFGPRTGTALRIFQRDRYLTPNGRVGRQTLRELLRKGS